MMPPTSILVIDDNEADYWLVREIVPESIDLKWCETATNARAILLDETFDLILLDHGLPDTNGLAFLGDLMVQCPECPVIMLTGREDPTLALSALQMGAQNYLVKSEMLEHLIPALEEALAVSLQAQTPVSDRFIDTAARFYPRLLETISDGCLVLDREGVVTFANRAGQSYASFLPTSLLGRDILDIFSPGTIADMRAHLREAKYARAPIARVFESRLGNGENEMPVRVSLHTLHDSDGAFQNAILIVNDLTEQVRARELRDDLVRAMVHDLRTPLSSILSAVELLVRLQQSQGQAGELLALIELSAGNMLGLIEQILDVERLEHGTLPLSFKETSLQSLLRRALQVQSHLASDKHLKLACHVPADDATAVLDPDLISRVLQNLLANAIRYSPTGETIEVSLSRPPINGDDGDTRDWLISVADCGPGIEPALAGRLFDKFVRGVDGGSGLGLTFCKFVVEAHGGTIWFEAAPERGTVFSFTLPPAPDFD